MKRQAQDVHTASDASLLSVILIAPVMTTCVILVSTLCLMTAVPRRVEGSREVPDLNWITYALMGNMIPLFVALIFSCLTYQTMRQRTLACLIVLVSCYVAHEMFLTNLLRRDFIGKF